VKPNWVAGQFGCVCVSDTHRFTSPVLVHMYDYSYELNSSLPNSASNFSTTFLETSLIASWPPPLADNALAFLTVTTSFAIFYTVPQESSQHNAMINLLITHGADINALDNSGRRHPAMAPSGAGDDDGVCFLGTFDDGRRRSAMADARSHKAGACYPLHCSWLGRETTVLLSFKCCLYGESLGGEWCKRQEERLSLNTLLHLTLFIDPVCALNVFFPVVWLYQSHM
jgi:hypothetical protein